MSRTLRFLRRTTIVPSARTVKWSASPALRPAASRTLFGIVVWPRDERDDDDDMTAPDNLSSCFIFRCSLAPANLQIAPIRSDSSENTCTDVKSAPGTAPRARFRTLCYVPVVALSVQSKQRAS